MARILVVDDTPQNLKLIELYLRGTEFEVVTADGGNDAIEQCMLSAFDLILLDVVMPGIDGFEVCRRLKNDPRTAFVPVIFLTGRMGDESEKIAAYQLGAVDYIQKPVDREELVARIRVMLRLEDTRSRLDRENAALRSQLTRTEQKLTELVTSFEGLQQLGEERAVEQMPTLLTLSAGLAIKSFDREIVETLGPLEVGRLLFDCGQIARRVAKLVTNGSRGGPLTIGEPGSDAQRELLVIVRRMTAGDVLVLMQDVTGVRRVERQIADRTLLESLPREAGPKESSYRMTEFVGGAPTVAAVTDKVARLRQKRSTVLVYGESGTGKELVARALHFDGRHRNAPFIPLHCGAIAPELIESELFGHEKGSFTGAQAASEGLFRAADGGTIFLDEIAETTPSVQVKLLRVLQRGEIRPVGANQPRIVDVRIIAATNRDLLELVREGKFREDLYYRLEVVTLHLPPLRERMQDLGMLAESFVKAANRRHERTERPVVGFSRGAMDRMMAYTWPGNVRELENVIEGAFALDVGEVFHEQDLPERIRKGAPILRPRPVQRALRGATLSPRAESGFVESGSAAAGRVESGPMQSGRSPSGHSLSGQSETGRLENGSHDMEVSADVSSVQRAENQESPMLGLRDRRVAAERDAIVQALHATGGDKIRAAQRLGMARSTFYRRIKEMGL